MKQVELAHYLQNFSELKRTTQLVRESGLRALLLYLEEGEEMAEHAVKGPMTVQCIQGSVLFRSAEGEAELVPGSLISLPGAVPHSLHARQASMMIVTVRE